MSKFYYKCTQTTSTNMLKLYFEILTEKITLEQKHEFVSMYVHRLTLKSYLDNLEYAYHVCKIILIRILIEEKH
jgi:hypothetical protein